MKHEMKSLVVALVACMVAALLLMGCGDKATTYEVKTDSQGGTQLVPVEGNPYESGSAFAPTWDRLKYATPDEVYRQQQQADKALGAHFEIDSATNWLVRVGTDGSRDVIQP